MDEDGDGAVDRYEMTSFCLMFEADSALQSVFNLIELGSSVAPQRLLEALCGNRRVREAIEAHETLRALLPSLPRDDPASLRARISPPQLLAAPSVDFARFRAICARLLRPKQDLCSDQHSMLKVLKRVFGLIDAGGSGVVSRDQVVAAFGVDSGCPEVRQLFRSSAVLRPLLLAHSVPDLFQMMDSNQVGCASASA
jgi:Ca2+-binding EF-hand superfamily protein